MDCASDKAAAGTAAAAAAVARAVNCSSKCRFDAEVSKYWEERRAAACAQFHTDFPILAVRASLADLLADGAETPPGGEEARVSGEYCRPSVFVADFGGHKTASVLRPCLSTDRRSASHVFAIRQ